MRLVLEFFRTDKADDPYAFRLTAQEYVLRTEGGGAQTAVLAWDKELLSDLQAVRQPGRDPARTQRLGDTLRRFLAPTDWPRQEADIAKAVQQGDPVLITVRSSAAELYALPWELLTVKDTGQPLGALPGVLLRYSWPETSTIAAEPEPRPEGGRILFAWSAAGGAVPAATHLDTIRKACAQGHYPFEPERDVLPALSYGRLQRALEQAAREEPAVTILHILCHGSQLGQTFGLCWDGNEAGDGAVVVDAGRLRDLLAPHATRLRLVVLCACDSGNGGELGNHLGSVAQALHRARIQAVVASRFPLSVAGSVDVCAALYGTLLGIPGSLESAFAAAQRQLARDAQSLDWASLQLYARAEDGEDTRPLVLRPYRGLLAFTAQHTRFFFGRDAERQHTLSSLRALADNGQSRFLIVAGASGTGKSSMVLSGAVPDLLGHAEGEAAEPDEVEALHRTLRQLTGLLSKRTQGRAVQEALQTLSKEAAVVGTSGQAWQVAILRPGADPLGALDVARAERKDAARPFLLVVDQFEEIFTQTGDRAVRQEFARKLWSLCKEDTGVHCIITLRVDFLGQCGEIVLDEAGLRLDRVAYDDAHRVFVAQLGREQLLAAIKGPARLVGLRLEEGLAERMLTDLGGEPGALPLLQYTLDELWQRRKGNYLTVAAYEEIGGVAGALEKDADKLLASLSEAQKKIARRLLVALVAVREDAGRDTRRRAPLAELRPTEVANSVLFDSVIDQLVSARLLVRSEEQTVPTVEVAHEALIRQWRTLRDWVAADRDMLSELTKLRSWAAEWQQDKTALLRDRRLGWAREVANNHAEDLDRTTREFLTASIAAAERQAKAAALRRRLLVSGALVVAAAISLAAAVARQQARAAHAASVLAEQRAREARINSLLVSASSTAERDPLLGALLLAEVDVLSGGEPVGGAQVAAAVAQRQIPLAVLRGHAGSVFSVQASHNGRAILTVASDKTARVWNADGRGPVVVLSGHQAVITSAAFSPDGGHVVTASRDQTVRVWRSDGQGTPVILRGHSAMVVAASFSPDGLAVVSASEDGTARVWRADGSEESIVLKGHESALTSAVFSPNGSRIVTASKDKTARIWTADGKGAPVVLRGHEAEVTWAAFSPDGQAVATSAKDSTARLWSADGKGEPRFLLHLELSSGGYVPLYGKGFSSDGKYVLLQGIDRVWTARVDGTEKPGNLTVSGLFDAAYSADSNLIVTASNDRASVWGLDSHHEPLVLAGHGGEVHSARFVPDSHQVLTGSDDGSARVWRLGSIGEPELLRPRAPASDVRAISADLNQLLGQAADHSTFLLWQSRLAGKPVVLKASSDKYQYYPVAAFSPDGKYIVLVLDDAMQVWQTDGKAAPVVFPSSGHRILCARFSPDGKRVAAAGDDKMVRIWRADGTAEPIVLKGHEQRVMSVAFSPDGMSVVSSSVDRTSRIWPVDGSSRPVVILRHPSAVLAASFSPDGRRVVTGGADRAVRVWSANGLREPTVLVGHTGAVFAVAFSPDGLHIASGSDDLTTRIWREDGVGDPIVLPGQPHHYISYVAFSPDSSQVVTLDDAGTARTWHVTWKGLLARLRSATTACLTPTQREHYLSESPREASAAFGACERREGRQPGAP